MASKIDQTQKGTNSEVTSLERRGLILHASGSSTDEISAELELSPHSVHQLLASVCSKLQTTNLAQAVVQVLSNGIVELKEFTGYPLPEPIIPGTRLHPPELSENIEDNRLDFAQTSVERVTLIIQPPYIAREDLYRWQQDTKAELEQDGIDIVEIHGALFSGFKTSTSS